MGPQFSLSQASHNCRIVDVKPSLPADSKAPRPALPALPARPARPARPGGAHVAAIDVVRLLTIGGVILVHSSSLADPGSLAADGVLVVAHVTRSVFLMVSAFVLTLSWRQRPAEALSFWKRRVPLIAAPYLAWTAIYFVAARPTGSAASVAGQFVADVADGGAHFHLYFLLLTFQLYLVFPALMAALRRHPGVLLPALAVTAALDLGLCASIHYGWRPPLLSVWFTHPSSWLVSYPFFVVGGIAAAVHLPALHTWIGHHYRLVAAAFVVSTLLTVLDFVAEIGLLGYSGLHASEVFQPTVAVEAVTAAAAQFALGMWWSERAPQRQRAWLERSSDASFGVYLAHPLLLGAVLWLAEMSGLAARLSAWPTGLIEVLVAVGLVPFLYATTAAAIDVVRRSPVSLWLTGRPAAGAPLRPRAAVATVMAGIAVGAVVPGWAGWAAPAAGQGAPVPGTSTASPPPPRPAPARAAAAAAAATTTTNASGETLPAGAAHPATAELAWSEQTYSFDFEGATRSYIVFRPVGSYTSLPVVVTLAGCCTSAQFEAGRMDFRTVSGPALLVYPEYLDGHWDAGACCGSSAADHVDDTGFVAAVLARVQASQSGAATGRAYLAGYSNGGKLALRLVCTESGLFQAVAVYGASDTYPCPQPARVSLLDIAGSADPEVSINGSGVVQNGYREPTVTAVVSDFEQADGCRGQAAVSTRGTLTEQRWTTCSGSASVALAVYAGATHTWPQASGATPSAEAVMWGFFASSGA